jgi:hypothetical protein
MGFFVFFLYLFKQKTTFMYNFIQNSILDGLICSFNIGYCSGKFFNWDVFKKRVHIKDRKSPFVLIAIHIQFLVGIILYFVFQMDYK